MVELVYHSRTAIHVPMVLYKMFLNGKANNFFKKEYMPGMFYIILCDKHAETPSADGCVTVLGYLNIRSEIWRRNLMDSMSL